MDPDHAMGSVNDYLESVRKEAFNVHDEDVVLIDPGLNTKKLYEEIELPCNKEKRMNNALDAPIRKDTKGKRRSPDKKERS
jgi:alkyl sulfatase BDS1-like metallo-beta-lactamase superfamily hydrolase